MEEKSLKSKDTSKSADSGDINIDFAKIVKSIKLNKKFVLKTMCVFIVLGIIVAIFRPAEYRTSTTLIPQGNEESGGGLSGLAAMAGISLRGASDNIPPKFYPQIFQNVSFQKELIYSSIKFEGYEEPIVLLDYYTNEEYSKPGVLGYIKKYTIGLPGVIIEAMRGDDDKVISPGAPVVGIPKLTKKEKRCIDIVLSKISLVTDNKDNSITLSVGMDEPLAAAELAEKTLVLLQDYITKFKIAKVQSNLDFIQERYNEAKEEYELIQEKRATFKDANRSINSSRALAESEKWDNRYNLAFSIYSELAKQLEQAKIQVKETTPMLTVLNPVTVPLEKTGFRRSMICAIFLFLGFSVAIGLVLGLPHIANIFGIEKLKKVIKE